MTPEPHRERTIERTAAAAFVVAAATAVGLIVLYWRGGQPQLEGLLIGVVFAATGLGLVLWANGLLNTGPYVEEREVLVATEDEAEALRKDLDRQGILERRTVLRRTLLLAGTAIGAALLFPIRSLGPKPGRTLLRTAWAPGVRVVTLDGTPVRSTTVPTDGLLTVFPEGDAGSADGQAVMMRVPPDLLQLPDGREAWTVDGIIAFSKVCTHAGCPVGLYEADTHQLLCPCHQSAFDVLTGARPISGPAAWPLPQLPLAQDANGVLHSTGDFSEPVGPGWWKA
jgi:ubiquinol-cytochrome c reductase iron-sulfur subunit